MARRVERTAGDSASPALAREVERAARARRRARRQAGREWSGFGVFGMVGWSVVVPTLAGAALGRWLDTSHPGGRSWTLTLLLAGLALGCLLAWQWLAREQRAISRADEDDDDDA
ncbi:MAG: AtpZ/AtpI family protein [Gammaproteobacteria bacterium]|nr:AtpZ/AtpI family protein [Gammaproteobacteria bacterium]